MTLLQAFFHLTNFKSPLLRCLVPTVASAFAIQTAFAVPSIAAQSDRFYDFSGALTFLACTGLSLYMPHLRARFSTAGAAQPPIPGLFATRASDGVPAFDWRQLVLSAAVAVWSLRLGSYLFNRVLVEGKDSRFDKIKTSPAKFSVAFFGQAVWVSCCLMPVIAINAVPAKAFLQVPMAGAHDILGLLVWLGGFTYEIVADRQKHDWLQAKRAKLHDEEFITRGLWARSRFPNYFGEIVLWVGLASAAGGTLLFRPIRTSLGLSGPLPILVMSSISPLFVSFLLLKVSGVPLSEAKYDKKYGDRKDYRTWKESTPKLVPKLVPKLS